MKKLVVLLRNGIQICTESKQDDVQKAYRIVEDAEMGGNILLAPEGSDPQVAVRVTDIMGMFIMEDSGIAIPQRPEVVPFQPNYKR